MKLDTEARAAIAEYTRGVIAAVREYRANPNAVVAAENAAAARRMRRWRMKRGHR